jgi:hypothetical protein
LRCRRRSKLEAISTLRKICHFDREYRGKPGTILLRFFLGRYKPVQCPRFVDHGRVVVFRQYISERPVSATKQPSFDGTGSISTTTQRLLTTIVCIAAVSWAGCAGTTPKVDNPVLGAAPPRKAGAVVALAEKDEDPAVVSVSFESTSPDDDEWNEVAGRVDGIPVFARDVLEADRPRLEQMKAQAPPEVYKQQRDKLLKMRLPQYLEQQLLLSAVRDEMNDEQMEAIEGQLDKMFGGEIDRLKGITKVSSVADLEEVLESQGTTLAQLKQVFFDRQMAGQYLGLKMSKVEPASRAELLAEYERRIDQYRKPADVKWQQVWISFSKHGSRDEAFKVLKKAADDIKAGVPFDVVIGRYSDGAMKEAGGLWDYTTRGNLANQDVEDALFTLPIGEVSRPYDVGKAFQIVRVADRRDERVTPFAEVQDDLAKEMAKKRESEAAGKEVAKLWNTAVIETRFDNDSDWQKMAADRYSPAESAESAIGTTTSN